MYFKATIWSGFSLLFLRLDNTNFLKMSLYSSTDHNVFQQVYFTFTSESPKLGLVLSVHPCPCQRGKDHFPWLSGWDFTNAGHWVLAFSPARGCFGLMLSMSCKPMVLLYKGVSLQPVPSQCFPHKCLCNAFLFNLLFKGMFRKERSSKKTNETIGYNLKFKNSVKSKCPEWWCAPDHHHPAPLAHSAITAAFCHKETSKKIQLIRRTS